MDCILVINHVIIYGTILEICSVKVYNKPECRCECLTSVVKNNISCD